MFFGDGLGCHGDLERGLLICGVVKGGNGGWGVKVQVMWGRGSRRKQKESQDAADVRCFSMEP